MPFVNVHILENTFSEDQKKEIITKITDAMVSIEGEPFRKVTWVKIEEAKEGSWGIAGQPLTRREVELIRKGGS
jgi:4-oxalocrotonate tautomerase